jgi:hypothetical protein
MTFDMVNNQYLEDILPQVWYCYALHLKKLDNAAYEDMIYSFILYNDENGICQVFKYHHFCCIGVILILTYYYRILRKEVFSFFFFNIRQIWRYQRSEIEEGQRIQWLKEKGQKIKQWYTKHYTERLSNANPTKLGKNQELRKGKHFLHH